MSNKSIVVDCKTASKNIADSLISPKNEPRSSPKYSKLLPLQGYLLKHSSSKSVVGGVVGGGFRKKRWFRFSPSNCILYYYRTSEDLFPLGEIGIESASFTIKPCKNFFIFEIISATTGKTLCLEASSASDGFRWVKNLQIFRHQFYQNKYQDGHNENKFPQPTKSTTTTRIISSSVQSSQTKRPAKYSDDLLQLECPTVDLSVATTTQDFVYNHNQEELPPPLELQQPEFNDNFDAEQWLGTDIPLQWGHISDFYFAIRIGESRIEN